MLKVVIVVLISFIGFKSWSAPAKSKRPKTVKDATLKRSSKQPVIPKNISDNLISDLTVKAELKSEVKKNMQDMADQVGKSGPRLLKQKVVIFNKSKQILQVLRGKKGDKENLELLVTLVSKQSLSMMSVKSKKQLENFEFLLTSIEGKLVASNVLLKDVFKEATEDYVVARKKVSNANKEKEGKKFLEDLKKLCNK